MSLEWIDVYVDGLIEYCCSNAVYEIYTFLDITISRVNEDSFMLQGNDSVYIRNYFGSEIVFIKSNLPYIFEKFVLAHELAHAILHTELLTAAYSKTLINQGQLEKQADYFAIKLLDTKLDSVWYEGLTKSQIAGDLFVREDVLEYMKG